MSDVTIPSYRVPRDRGVGAATRRLLVIAAVLLGCAAGAGAVVWGFDRMGAPRVVPVIEADSRPFKIRPLDPGGLIVPNTNQLVLEPPAVRRAAERAQGGQSRLAPAPEAPQLDLLRREAAPPTQPSPGPAATAAPPEPVEVAAPGDSLPPIAAPPRAEAPAAAPRTAEREAAGAATATPPPPRPTAVVATTPAAPPAPVTTGGGQARVQLGALPSEEAARSEWARLQRRVPELAEHRPQIQRFDRGGDQPPLYRLRTGGLADTAAARSLCESVRAAGGVCMPIGL